ncbi:MAG: sugar transporter, partial [Sphingobacteriaceae bacterium]
DKNGAINFPVLGSVHLAGLTKEQATDKMTAEIKQHIKDPIVNVKFLNFRITVIGEVNRPSTFTLPTERVNLIEALALAGDLTAYGKRENILIIHEDEGIRSTIRVDLNDKSLLNSSHYYLQQNDIVYVEPAKVKKLQTGSSSFYLGLITVGVSVLSIFVFLAR